MKVIMYGEWFEGVLHRGKGVGEKVFLYIFSFVGISCYFPLLVTLVMKQRKHKRCWLSDPTKEKKEIKLRQNTPQRTGGEKLDRIII